MVTGIAFSLLAVYLLQYLDDLLVTLLYFVHRNIIIVKLSNVYIIYILAAAECIVLDILSEHAQLYIRELLTTVKSPASNRLDSRRNRDLLK